MSNNQVEYGVCEIQTILYQMVKEFVRICDENDIQYYLVKGGLIGAVRHKGFIPWDPDIDFAIPQNQLSTFCRVMNDELIEPFELNFYTTKGNYEYLFPRIGIKGIDYRQLHLDVFLLASAPNRKEEQDRYFRTINWWEKMNTIRNSMINRPVNSYLNRLILIILRLFCFWISPNWLRKKYEKLAVKYENNTEYYIQIGAVDEYGEKYIMPKKWFGVGERLSFESIKVKAPVDYDAYLKRMYGEYMSFPSEDSILRQGNRKWKLKKDVIAGLIQ